MKLMAWARPWSTRLFEMQPRLFGMSYEDTVRNVRELINIELNEHASGEVHGYGLDHKHGHDHS